MCREQDIPMGQEGQESRERKRRQSMTKAKDGWIDNEKRCTVRKSQMRGGGENFS